MRNFIKLTKSFTVLLLILTVSCKKEKDVAPLNNSTSIKFKKIEFLGEEVYVYETINPKLLVQTTDELNQYIKSLLTLKSRTSNYLLALSLEETVEVISKYRHKYPDLSLENELMKKDVNRIFKDFPNIKSEEEIREKSDFILRFYNGLLKIEVLPELIERAINKKNARGIKESSSDMNPYESTVVWNHPIWAPFYFAAGLQALNASGYATDGTRMNSVQHSTWNCFIIIKVILGGGSKSSAITYARETTSAHEWNADGTSRKSDDHTAMDLHNNRVGRTWMNENTSWGVAFLRKIPSDDKIVSWMTARANEAANWQNATNILSIHGYNWDRLFNENLWDYPGVIPFLVFIED